MADRDYEQIIVLSSYVDGSEIYRGHNMEKAKRLARAHGDKHTFYILTFDGDETKIEIERCYARGEIESSELMEVHPEEMKHFKTLLSLLD